MYLSPPPSPPAPFSLHSSHPLLLICFTFTPRTTLWFLFWLHKCVSYGIVSCFAVSLCSDLQNALKLFLYLIDTLLQYAFWYTLGPERIWRTFCSFLFSLLGRVNIELYLWTRFRCSSKRNEKNQIEYFQKDRRLYN